VAGAGLLAGAAAAQDGGEEAGPVNSPLSFSTGEPADSSGDEASPAPSGSAILTLDQEAMFTNSELGKRIIADLERDRTALAAENRRIEDQLSAEEKELTQKRGTMPPDQFSKLADAFDAKVQGFRSSQDSKSRALQQRLETARQNFAKQIAPILAQIVRARGAVAILDRSTVLAASDSIDITAEAIRRLDATVGDGSELGIGGPRIAPQSGGDGTTAPDGTGTDAGGTGTTAPVTTPDVLPPPPAPGSGSAGSGSSVGAP